MSPYPQSPADLITVTEEILNGKLHFLCSEIIYLNYKIRRNITPQTYIMHLIIHQHLK